MNVDENSQIDSTLLRSWQLLGGQVRLSLCPQVPVQSALGCDAVCSCELWPGHAFGTLEQWLPNREPAPNQESSVNGSQNSVLIRLSVGAEAMAAKSKTALTAFGPPKPSEYHRMSATLRSGSPGQRLCALPRPAAATPRMTTVPMSGACGRPGNSRR